MVPKYIEIKTHKLVETEDIHFVINKVFNRLHGILKSSGIRVGLDFPFSSEYSPGNIIRMFAKALTLELVAENKGIQELLVRSMISVSPAQDIPSNSFKLYCKRIRRKGKKEVMKRALRKMEHLKKKDATGRQIESQHKLAKAMMNKESHPYLLFHKNNQKFPIHFAFNKVYSTEDFNEQGFNSYGFSTTNQGYIYRMF